MRKKRLNDHSTFEILSDISLSTLGLFLIFLIVYSLVFNSASIKLINNINFLNNRIDYLTKESQELKRKNSNLIDEKERLNQKIIYANERADNTEREKELALEKNQYTGYYTGNVDGKFYSYDCSGNYEVIRQRYTLIYLQKSQRIIYSIESTKGRINYRIRGSLQGNTFEGKFSDHSRTENIKPCNSSYNEKIYIDFFSDRLEMYNSPNDNNRITLKKRG